MYFVLVDEGLVVGLIWFGLDCLGLRHCVGWVGMDWRLEGLDLGGGMIEGVRCTTAYTIMLVSTENTELQIQVDIELHSQLSHGPF